jgi:hypothetical protein
MTDGREAKVVEEWIKRGNDSLRVLVSRDRSQTLRVRYEEAARCLDSVDNLASSVLHLSRHNRQGRTLRDCCVEWGWRMVLCRGLDRS